MNRGTTNAMYDYRRMTPEQQKQIVTTNETRHVP